LDANFRYRRRIPPLLLASGLPDKPGVPKFVLAVKSQSSAQKGMLWWASKHRHHHLYSDTDINIHSPRHKGLIYSHLGWVLSRRNDVADLVEVADFARYPELMWLHIACGRR
jgi:stearoyl-CoA desaturase (Delta-9 desaturase)